MRVVALGSKEMVLGIRLTGIKEVYYREEVDDLNNLVESLLQREDVGILIMDDSSYRSLSWAVQKRVENTARPSVVVVPDYGRKTMETETLDVLVKRALGFELKKG